MIKIVKIGRLLLGVVMVLCAVVSHAEKPTIRGSFSKESVEVA